MSVFAVIVASYFEPFAMDSESCPLSLEAFDPSLGACVGMFPLILTVLNRD